MKILRTLFLFLLLASCSQQQTSIVAKGGLRVNIGSEPITLDPRKARDLNSSGMCRVLFEGLTRVSREGRPESALAEKIEVSSDGKQYIFTIRESFWSNGDPITAHDFAYSWRKSLDPQFPSPRAEQLYIIKGARAAKEGKISVDEIAIHTPNDKTLIVELEHAAPYFLEILSTPISFAVPKKAEEAKKSWCSEAEGFICNGPFCLKQWKHQDLLRVEKNAAYWDEKNVKLPSIFFIMVSPEVELSMFESGDLDWAGSPFSTLPLDALKNLKQSPLFSTALYSGTIFLRVNTADENAKGLLGCRSFRKALSSSIDRSFMISHLLPGGQLPTADLVPSALLSSQAGQRETSAATFFQEFLQETGMKKEEILPIKLSYISQEVNHLIAQALQREWKESLGLTVELQAVEPKIFYDAVARGNYQLAISSWFADFNDPINFLELFKYKDGKCNHTFWQNQEYIHLLDQSEDMTNKKMREQLLQEAQEVLMKEMPIIPIYQASLCYLKKNEIKGVYVSPLGYVEFKWVEVSR